MRRGYARVRRAASVAQCSVTAGFPYQFVTHAFGDLVRGAMGVLATPHAPQAGGGHDMTPAAADATATKPDVNGRRA